MAPSSPSIPKAPVKSKERDPASILDLDSTYTVQGRHPVPRRHLSFHEDILDTSDSNIPQLFQENLNGQFANGISPQLPVLSGISPIRKDAAPVQADNTAAKEQEKKDAAQTQAQYVGNDALVQGACALQLTEADIVHTQGAGPAAPQANDTEVTFTKGSRLDLNISDTMMQATSTPLPASPKSPKSNKGP